ncbi:homocysteine S-methyltransferase family protein [Shewanella intestini]|uniref:Homocysteine S-methyltransferase family protein n=1 Tax=Shewanella intestini TaxID=2017544 RepID=A0ABS5I1Y0_9GAMM|nr:homocysteine S-methyltransferase family protein [Shewanella sp. XMDDZSB0408]MBR9728038.1 homocysteine S-methyltransferase family protein [Shewanella intestini]MRG36411.1 homocysteine S-methyltransferase [Shewanella sp. XMDDZSB0408]
MSKLTILDGGMGRELKRIGAPFSQPLWSAQALIEAPQSVQQAHQGFIDAGAEIITANSYACVPFHLGQALYAEQGFALAQLAAKLARDCADKATQSVIVAGCIPPALGSYRPDLFKADTAKAISQTLFDAQDAYVDMWLAETLSSLAEFRVIENVLSATNKACCYSFSLADSLDGEPKLRSGERVQDVVQQVCDSGAQGVYFNCCIPEVCEQAIAIANDIITANNVDIVIGVYANSFTPITTGHQANDAIQGMRELTPADYLAFAKKWYQAGARVIGGCCGIEPSHIQSLSNWSHRIEKS